MQEYSILFSIALFFFFFLCLLLLVEFEPLVPHLPLNLGCSRRRQVAYMPTVWASRIRNSCGCAVACSSQTSRSTLLRREAEPGLTYLPYSTPL